MVWAVDYDVRVPKSSIRDVNYWTTFTNDLVKFIGEELCIIVPKILLNNTPQVLKSEFFILREILPYKGLRASLTHHFTHRWGQTRRVYAFFQGH